MSSADNNRPAGSRKPNNPPTDVEIAGWLRALIDPATAIELRAPTFRPRGRSKPVPAVRRFRGDDHLGAAREAIRLSASAEAVYFVLNGVAPALLASPEGPDGAKAEDIPRRRWLFVDCDPTKAAKGSATDAEKAAAHALARAVRAGLKADGWPAPVVCDSGNGFHLLWRIDLPADDGGLAKQVLQALARRFVAEGAAVDTSVHDAPRLAKLYGTKAGKGEDTPERPHRFARVLTTPAEVEVVAEERLRALVAAHPAEAPAAPAAPAQAPPAKRYRRDAAHGDRWTPEMRAAAYLETCEPAIDGQKGSDKAFKAACKAGPGFDLPMETAIRLFREVYNPKCQPPWSEAEIRHKFEGAYAKEVRRGFLLEADRDPQPADGSRPPRKPPAPPGSAPSSPGTSPGVERPTIEVNTERHRVVDEVLEALRADPELYRRGPYLVAVARESQPDQRLTSKSVMRQVAGSPKIITLSEAVIGTRITRFADLYTWREGKKGECISVPAHPPDWLIRAVTTGQVWPTIRPLNAVVECPYPRPDGSIVEAPGYDADTATLYLPGLPFPPIPESPTRDDARAAWDRLKGYVRQFPFATEDDRVVYLAGVLVLIGRMAIGGPVPGIAVVGNKAGTGKGLLVAAMTMPATGRPAPSTNYPDDKEEAAKVKTSIILAGKPVVSFDNLPEGSTYGGSVLDSVMTEYTIDDRIMGGNKQTGELQVRTTWFLNGNNLVPVKDAYRRWLVCNLVTDLESPHLRTDIEDVNLRELMIEHRGEIVRDALTILRAHALAGWPKGDWAPSGSFYDWDRVVRGAVWFATGRDCLATQHQAAEESPERLMKIALLEGWAELPGGKLGEGGVTAQEAVALVEESPDRYPTLRGALMQMGRGGKLATATMLGNRLRGLKENRIGGYRLAEVGKRHKVVCWVVSTSSTRTADGRAEESSGCASPPPRGEKMTDNYSYTSAIDADAQGASEVQHPPRPPASRPTVEVDPDDWTSRPGFDWG